MSEKVGQVLQIRTNEELVARFKQISEELEVPYGAALDLLLQSYELGQLKRAVPGREKEIEEVEIITRRFLEIYQNSVQLNKTAEDSIRESYSKQLETQGNIVTRLESELNSIQEENKSIRELLGDAKRDMEVLEEARNTSKALVESQKERVNSLSGLLAEHQGYKDDNVKLKSKLEELTKLLEIQELAKRTAADQLHKMKEQHQLEIEKLVNKHAAEMNEVKAGYQNTIFEIREEYNKKLLSHINGFTDKK